MKLCDLLGVIMKGVQVCVRGRSFDKITATPYDLLHTTVYKIVNAKVIEVFPIGEEIIGVWVDENECGE